MAAALAGWYDRLYLSDDQTLDADDLYIAQSQAFPPLDAGATYGTFLSGSIPAGHGIGQQVPADPGECNGRAERDERREQRDRGPDHAGHA